jgi:hypothetical protein
MVGDNATVPEKEPRERLAGRAVPPSPRSESGAAQSQDTAEQERWLVAQGLTSTQARRLIRFRQRRRDEATTADRRMAFVKYMVDRGLISDDAPSARKPRRRN